ncbi:unnamed protein product [marine sediment metagenome]|uniref:Uncharacterized protein n=1 Tax=marine sediment metagenome TaxID=412755 RepID=X0ZVV1_9ZZZZ
MKMKLGTMVLITEGTNLKESFKEVAELGFQTCQISCTAEFMIDKLKPKDIRKVSREFGIEISSLCKYVGRKTLMASISLLFINSSASANTLAPVKLAISFALSCRISDTPTTLTFCKAL